MILVIRISGMVSISSEVAETLHRMRLRKKYVAVLIKDDAETAKVLNKIRNYVAYGTISKEMIEQLLEKRGKGINNKKFDVKKVLSQIESKPLEELGVKPFFRLHPPRKGIESKKHFGTGKGVLGNNKEAINQLLERML
jgi:large subunit ribosomal protein L30